jgi:lysophospholipid acyltransferase (LPLAT)-like uncharacterized protein
MTGFPLTAAGNDEDDEGSMIKIRLLSFLASTYLRWVGLTSRIVWVNRSIRDDLEATGKGFIYAFWHGRQVFLAYLHRGDRVHPLISRSEDGEIIAHVCRSFQLEPIRGSSSRGASQAVLKLKDQIENGDRIGVTPDGPRGPLRQVQPGALYLAQVTGRPIVPICYGAMKKWVFKGWDEFMVPKPFNRIAVIYGEPIRVGPQDSLDQKAAELQRALNHVMHEADVISRGECHDEKALAPS